MTRLIPTVRQITALARMGWLESRGRHVEAAASFLRFAYGYRDGASAWDQFPAEWQAAVTENAEAPLVDIHIAVGAYPSARELATIRSPVVCACGSRSANAIVRVTPTLARLIPTATLHQIEGAGHAAPFDAPANFVKIVAEATRAN